METKLTNEQIKAIVEQVDKMTSRTAYKLTVVPDRKPGLCDTKFGGVPYWDTKGEYPNLLGEPLVLLAQINLNDIGENEYLPDRGLLQFFILPDDVYGCNFDAPAANDTFCVIYHAEIDTAVTAEDVLALNIPTAAAAAKNNDIGLPLFGEYELAVDVRKTDVSVGTNSYEYDEIFAKAAQKLGIELPDHWSAYSLLSEEFCELECEKNAGHWLFGYPYFTQYDPREHSDELRYYDTMLFQMDSDCPKGSSYKILWGDSGVANFFINRDDLESLDFSQVMYTWDCC